MSHASCLSHPIEQIDLTGDPNPGVSQNQKNSHFDVQLYVLNHQQSLKNETTVWHRNTDDSFHAIEHTDSSLYLQDRTPYLDRDGQVDEQWANQKWQQWSERDFHPAVEAFTNYNGSSPEMVILGNVRENLDYGGAAIQNMWAEIACADKILEVTAMPLRSQNLSGLTAAMRDILGDLAMYLRQNQKAQQESKKQLESLGLAIRSLIRSKTISGKAEKKREAADEKMLDTVKFLKECLNNHSRLVDIVLGRPEPLVQQGTDLMQAMLSEMFGLPVPTMQEPAEECMQQSMGDPMEEVESELESESEIEYLWESSQPEDLMDIEAVESCGAESDYYDGDSTDEQFNEYDDNMSEYSNYSATFENKSERVLRKEKRDRAKKARKELWSRFGLTVEKDKEDQNDAQEEEHKKFKRQKRSHNTVHEDLPESRLTADNKPQGLRQTTLNFNKVNKSRRLFSRKELNQKGVLKEQEKEKEEEADEKAVVASPGSVHRNSKRYVRVPPGYRYQQPKSISAGPRLLTHRRTGQS